MIAFIVPSGTEKTNTSLAMIAVNNLMSDDVARRAKIFQWLRRR